MTGAIRANGLALLAHKCAANTFDLSTGVVHASMRDQIVRAQLLMRDLKKNDPQCERILIVGGGVCGVSAASMAAHLGMDVVLVDTQAEPFSLQASVRSRYVGPFMYEWPELGHDCQDYPPADPLGQPSDATPTWRFSEPVPAAKFARELSMWLKGHSFTPGRARFFFGVNAGDVQTYVRDFIAHHGALAVVSGTKRGAPKFQLPGGCLDHKGEDAKGGESFIPDYVVLAAGMGDEQIALPDFPVVTGTPFWSNDGLKSPAVAKVDSAVFGGGDGALQDVLRLVTRHNHPLQFIRALQREPAAWASIERHSRHLEAMERQSRLVTTWAGSGSFAEIDEKCQKISADLALDPVVREAVRRELRPGQGSVHQVVREPNFGKAYLLNRFAVHLIEQCQHEEMPPGTVRYYAHRSTSVMSASYNGRSAATGYRITLSDRAAPYVFRHVAVRYGVDPATLPQAKLVKLHPATRADRLSMAAIPLPFVVSD